MSFRVFFKSGNLIIEKIVTKNLSIYFYSTNLQLFLSLFKSGNIIIIIFYITTPNDNKSHIIEILTGI